VFNSDCKALISFSEKRSEIFSPFHLFESARLLVNMGKSTEGKLWCIKIISNAAYLFKGRKRVPHFQNIVKAEANIYESKQDSSSSVSAAGQSSVIKKIVKVVSETC